MGTLVEIDGIPGRYPAQVLRLAQLLSFATLVDPRLVREMRLKFLPESDAGLEADVWFLPFVEHTGADGFVFRAAAAEALRRSLAQEAPELYEEAWAETARVHQTLPPALLLEEEVGYLLHSRHDDRDKRIRDLFRSAIAALRDPTRGGLAHWAARALPRFPSEVRSREEARMLAAGASFRLSEGISSCGLLAKEEVAEWGAWLAPHDLQRTTVCVRLFADVLEIAPAGELPEAQEMDLPKTDPLVLEVSERHFAGAPPEESRGPLIFISYARAEEGFADAIYEGLNHQLEHLREGDIFYDKVSITGGADFLEEINAAAAAARVILAIEGPSSVKDDVYRAIVERYAGGRAVIPVLVGNATVADLKGPLASYHAMAIRPDSFGQDMLSLARDVEKNLPSGQHPGKAVSFQSVTFREGETPRISVTSDALLLRTVIGEEYTVMTVERALEDASALADEERRMEELLFLAPKVKGAVVEKALSAARSFQHPLDRLKLLAALSHQQDVEERERTIGHAFYLLEAVHEEREKAEGLIFLAPYVPQGRWNWLLDPILAIENQTLKEKVVRQLAKYLPADVTERYFPNVSHKKSLFLSASASLLPYREALAAALSEMEIIGVQNATADNIMQVLEDAISNADIYICLVGTRHGYIPDLKSNPEALSVVELELRFAQRLGKPMLIFLQAETSSADKDAVASRKWRQFRERLRATYTVSYVSSPSDFVFQAVAGLENLLHVEVNQRARTTQTEEETPVQDKESLRQEVSRWEAQVERVGGKPWREVMSRRPPAKAINELVNLSHAMVRLAKSYAGDGEFADALALLGDLLAIGEALEDPSLIAVAHEERAAIHEATGDYNQAAWALDRARDEARKSGSKILEGRALHAHGRLALKQRKHLEADYLLRAGLQCLQEVRDNNGIMQTASLLGIVALERGELDAAQELLTGSLTLAQELQDKHGFAQAKQYLGRVFRARAEDSYQKGERTLADGLLADAREHLETSLTAYEEMDVRIGVCDCWSELAVVHLLQGEFPQAREYALKAVEVRESLRVPGVHHDYDTLSKIAKAMGEPMAAEKWGKMHEAVVRRLEKMPA